MAVLDICRRYCTYYADLDAAAKRKYDEKLDMLPGLVDDSCLSIIPAIVNWKKLHQLLYCSNGNQLSFQYRQQQLRKIHLVCFYLLHTKVIRFSVY